MFSWLTSLFNGLWPFFKPLLTLFGSKVGKVVLQSAASAVPIVAQQMTGRLGSEKAKVAYDMIVEDLKGQGKQLGVDFISAMVNTAIEAAYVKLPDSLK